METDRSRAQALSDRLLAVRRAHRRAEHQLATLLAELAEGRLYQSLGYASLGEYAESVLDLPARQARDLRRIGRALPGLPTLGAALEAGELDWTKAREVVRVATPETEAAWVERARAVPCRVLEREVANARVGERPPDGSPQPDRRPSRERMVLDLESADNEQFSTMLALLAAKLGTDCEELDRSALVGAAALMVIELLEREEAALEATPTGERYRIVIDHCPDCRDNTIRTIDANREVSDSVAAEAACDAEVVEMRPGPAQGHATRAIPPATRRKVLHRAEWRCEVPYCRSRLWLDIHHIEGWAAGGTHALGNLACVCSAHHRAIHLGCLALERGSGGRITVTRWNAQVSRGRDPRVSSVKVSTSGGNADRHQIIARPRQRRHVGLDTDGTRKVNMARNNISLSVDDLPDGRFKVRWREDVITDGKRERKTRSQTVSDKGARDALVARLRRSLESGEVYEPEARTVTTAANLELAALAWLRWQESRDRKQGTRNKYRDGIARIMRTIRKVRNIRADAVIPVSVLDVQLFADVRNVWIAEDAAAERDAASRGACSPMRRYHLSGFLFALWSFAASQPAKFPGVPALVDRGLVIPPVPPQPSAPEAPTWPECDAVVRRAYVASAVLGDLLVGLRLLGLRVSQVESIRRRAIDPVRCTLQVEVGKSAAENAEKRIVPIPRSLVDLWQARIAACPGPDAFLFPAATRSGHTHFASERVAQLWREAEKAGEVRPNIYNPLSRREARPNHAFRAAYMAGLQAITVEVDGAPVQRISDRTIDFLVGHAPMDTRARHYTPPTRAALVAAVGFIPPIDLKATPAAAGGNLVAGPW